MAESARSKGFKVNILDANAEKLDPASILLRLKEINPRILCLVVYGQNVNAGTANMSGAIFISDYLKKNDFKSPICIIGSHVQALPIETLKKEKSIDFVFTNEAVYALRNVLKLFDFTSRSLSTIKGIAFREGEEIIMSPPEKVVATKDMDNDLPGYAWDLLPFKKEPFDLYR